MQNVKMAPGDSAATEISFSLVLLYNQYLLTVLVLMIQIPTCLPKNKQKNNKKTTTTINKQNKKNKTTTTMNMVKFKISLLVYKYPKIVTTFTEFLYFPFSNQDFDFGIFRAFTVLQFVF